MTNATLPTQPSTTSAVERRNDVAAAVFSAWVVVGLFVDGWAHNAEKPENFWTPWHAMLYSGFVAASVYFAVQQRRDRRRGVHVPTPRLVVAGFALFAFGGVADMLWHQVFGVEEDVEALLSPTHLTLMIGGLLLTTEPLRAALANGRRQPSSLAFLPAMVSLTLAVAIVGFFLQFASAFRLEDLDIFTAAATEGDQVHGILSLLLTNGLLLGAAAWALRHWRTPPGTFTVLFGGAALLLSGLHAFDEIALVVPAIAAGAFADALVARGASRTTILTATPVALWGAWFAAFHAVWGLGWPVELWTGSLVLTALTGFGLNLVAVERARG